MNSPWQTPDGTPRRHALVTLSEAGWRRQLRERADLASEPLVLRWAENGWPLVVRRWRAGETAQPSMLPLGLPLPPSAGKLRLHLCAHREDVLAIAPPLAMSLAIDAAAPPWRPTMASLVRLAAMHDVRARVFGSLAWQSLTGLQYVGADSDLDLLMPLVRGTDLAALVKELAAIESRAPMRLDGEVVRPDGTATTWRELRAGAGVVLVKTQRSALLMPAGLFAGELAS